MTKYRYKLHFCHGGWDETFSFKTLYGLIQKCHHLYDGNYLEECSRWNKALSKMLLKRKTIYFSPYYYIFCEKV